MDLSDKRVADLFYKIMRGIVDAKYKHVCINCYSAYTTKKESFECCSNLMPEIQKYNIGDVIKLYFVNSFNGFSPEKITFRRFKILKVISIGKLNKKRYKYLLEDLENGIKEKIEQRDMNIKNPFER